MAEDVLRTILLIEDEPADAELLLRAFDKAKVLNPIVHLSNGNDALRYLAGRGELNDGIKFPLPALILLDLKLPGMTGIELLQWIHVQGDIKCIPLVVLTADGRQETVDSAHSLCARSYLVKPGNPDEIARMVKLLQSYWIALNQPPQLVMAASLFN